MQTPNSPIQLGFRGPVGIVALVFGIMAVIFVPVGLIVAEVRIPFVIVGAAFAGMALVLGKRAMRHGQGLAQLAQHGVPYKGEVLRWAPTLVRINSVSQYRLRFRFTGPDGIEREAWSAYRRPEDVVRLDPHDLVTVLVDPDRPEVFALERDVIRTT
jgi:hypothetical protein